MSMKEQILMNRKQNILLIPIQKNGNDRHGSMKFNRMVLYLQNVWHTAYVNPGMFTDDVYRLNPTVFYLGGNMEDNFNGIEEYRNVFPIDYCKQLIETFEQRASMQLTEHQTGFKNQDERIFMDMSNHNNMFHVDADLCKFFPIKL